MKPKTALVIDDSKLIHKMFRVLLDDCRLHHATNGHEALRCLQHAPDMDLILLDINMPEMNGLEFLARIKEQEALAHIPVIIISTEGTEEDTLRGLEAGADAYVRKPFDENEVLRIVEQL